MGLFETVIEVIRDNRITGKSLSESVECVNNIVSELIERADLPKEIAVRYKDFGIDNTLLYAAESYRDHFFHPYHTFLIGFKILKIFKEKEGKRSEFQFKSPIPCDDDFLKKWLLTSLWHDITYTIEKGPEWLEGYIKNTLGFDVSVSHEWGSILANEENVNALRAMAKTFEPTDFTRRLTLYIWFTKQLIKYNDHGVLSGIKLIREFRSNEEWPISEEDMVYECALSIAMHNFPKSICSDKNKIKSKDLRLKDSQSAKIDILNINAFPLAFLLSLCDTAQEWGRPSIRNISEHIRFEEVEVRESEKTVCIKLSFDIKKYKEIRDSENSNITEQSAWNEIKEDWEGDKKVGALNECWTNSNKEWRFQIKQTATNFSGVVRENPLQAHKL